MYVRTHNTHDLVRLGRAATKLDTTVLPIKLHQCITTLTLHTTGIPVWDDSRKNFDKLNGGVFHVSKILKAYRMW